MDQEPATYIGIALGDGQTFTNASSNDLVMFTPHPSKMLIGTNAQVASQLEINNNRVVINDDTTVYGNLQVSNGASIAGATIVYNDLFVQGNLVTRQDLVITGVQVATGATYCNGDLYVTNDTVGMSSSNATLYVTSKAGLPMVSLQQGSNTNTNPFILYQTQNGDAYIMNGRNMYLGTSNVSRQVLITSNGNMGIGTSNPRQRLDVFQGNVNAQNVMRLRKSVASSNPVTVNVNWTSNVSGPQHNMIIQTTQQFGTPVFQGSRRQEHKVLVSPFTHVPQVACGFGDKECYTTLFVTASNTSLTSMAIQSTVSGFQGANSNVVHELDVDIRIAPSVLGHVWLS